MTPDCSRLPAGTVVEYSNPLERQFSQNLTRKSERGYLSDLAPAYLSAKEFEILAAILAIFGESELLLATFECLQDEKTVRHDEAVFAMIFLLKHSTKNSKKCLPSQIVTELVNEKCKSVKCTKDLGSNLLRVHLLQAILRNRLEPRFVQNNLRRY